jgi:predicted CxxxxCH...CXXCH cytochrome family protein
MQRTSILALFLVTAAACSEERERPSVAVCATWKTDVQAALAERCLDCHAGEAPAGGYDLSTYNGALGGGSDNTPNAVAGDADSLLLTYLRAATANSAHQPFTSLEPLAREWVTECKLALGRSKIHDPGILNPAADDFHGALLRELAYDFSVCIECHGEDFTGGTSNTACTSCHRDGPTACDTCHGEIPSSGAHQTHVNGGELERSFECALCHQVPERYDSPGHLLLPSGRVDPPPAEVEFSGLAVAVASASYDPVTGTCGGVYCHTAATADANAGVPSPVWTAGPSQAVCGSCHGIAPASHASDRCELCHQRVVDSTGFVDRQRHVDGIVELGRGTGDCGDCHGSDPSGAPPADLGGGTSTDLVTVGAHESHVLATGRLSAPIPCTACHTAPRAIGDPGHIDSAGSAEVFPAGLGGVAFADGASPAWDRATGRCADTYCHGNGNGLADDTSPGLSRTPGWTQVGSGQAACGTCHGAPPSGVPHQPSFPLSSCRSCHTRTVDQFGTIIVSGPPGAQTSEHVDGNVDF